MTPLLTQPEVALVAAPALGGALAFALGLRRVPLITSSVVVVMALSLAATIHRLLATGAYSHVIGGWVAPLGIAWRIDGLAAVMLLLSTLVGSIVSWYALSYYGRSATDRHQAGFFWPLWMLLWAGLNALFLARDIFNWYVTLELTGLAAVALITLSGKPAALAGGMRYLLLALSASLFYLLGVALLYGEYGTLDLDGLAAVVQPGPLTGVALAAITVGLLVKAALFPLHFWLPPAHANAPSPVSAVLSALVVKGGFYILLRFITELWPRTMTASLMDGLGWLGAAAILFGSFHAIRQRQLKQLIAYSTVAQLGYLFLMFPLLKLGWETGHTDLASRAWAGGIYQALAHGLAKASLFLAAGVLIHARGNDALDGLRGLGERLPVTATAMALAGISLMGIPPGAGFLAKWMLLSAAVTAQQGLWAGVMIAGGLMAVGYLFRIYRRLMTTAENPHFHQPPRALEHAALALAVLSIFFGLSSLPVLDLLTIGAPGGLTLYFGGAAP